MRIAFENSYKWRHVINIKTFESVLYFSKNFSKVTIERIFQLQIHIPILFFTLSVSILIKKKSLNSKVSKNKKKKKKNNNVSLEKYNGSHLKKNS